MTPKDGVFVSSGESHSMRWTRFAACAFLVSLSMPAVPAWPQTNCPAPGNKAPEPINTKPAGCSDFFDCFVANNNIDCYGIRLPSGNGQRALGDLNATYFELFYSMTNALTLGGVTPSKYELVLVGTFPNTRYFSITNNDMHYANAEHLADFTIDPAAGPNGSYSNPFTTNQPWAAGQWWMVPVTLGAIPSAPNGGCGMNPSEQDNLLDATQRHPSMDWNSVASTDGSETAPPATATPHVVDTPSHSAPTTTNPNGENMAGVLLFRDYLTPPGGDVPPPYVIIRDVTTGCAYYNPTYYSYDPPLVNRGFHDCTVPTAGCGALVSDVDLSCPLNKPACGITNWLDTSQHVLHVRQTEVTPQACYANGDAHLKRKPSYANMAAWVRNPEYVGRPAPDNGYLAALISSTDLKAIAANGGAIEMQFQLPHMPTIPCNSGGCELSGTEQLRYYGLSFIQQQPSGSKIPQIANPEEVYTPKASPLETIVSLADPAFCANATCSVPASCSSATAPCYVTLIVGVGPSLSSIPTTGCAPNGGFQPATNFKGGCSVMWGNGYTVLDLAQFISPACTTACFSTSQDLELLIRNMLPNATHSAEPTAFNCSALAVPFYTEEYTNVNGINGAGLMGPYAPLVSYRAISSLTKIPAPTPSLPPTIGCGVLPSSAPVLTTAGMALRFPSHVVQWPTFWPAATPSPLNLYCTQPPNQPTSPAIDFVASLVPHEDYSVCGTPGACNYVYPLSPQTDAFTTATPPPLNVTIAGTGFGYLPEILPYVTKSSTYLRIQDDGHGSGTAWDTNAGNSCQMYIANWTDTSIALVVNAPIDAYNQYLGEGPQNWLSPLSDFSPLTLFTNAYNTWSCPVSMGDSLTFSVINPQTGAGPSVSHICVGTPGTPAICPT